MPENKPPSSIPPEAIRTMKKDLRGKDAQEKPAPPTPAPTPMPIPAPAPTTTPQPEALKNINEQK